jgi:hypothetical protein
MGTELDATTFELPQHEAARAFYSSTARFNVVNAGRRALKSHVARRRIVRGALMETEYSDALFWVCAPTIDQAMTHNWDKLLNLIPSDYIWREPNLTRREIRLINSSIIRVMGMEKPERAQGHAIRKIMVDELDSIKGKPGRFWDVHLRPTLADQNGTGDLLGRPEGRRHLYHFHKLAVRRPNWQYHHWTSEGVLPGEEIDDMRGSMDEFVFKQEVLAQFVMFQGRAYYNFDSDKNVKRCRYDPTLPLIFCLDFGNAPGVAVVIQDHSEIDETWVIGEVWIEQHSVTPMVVGRFIEDWGEHQGEVWVYGDPAGGAHYSSAATSDQTDWVWVDKLLHNHFGPRITMDVAKRQPTQRSRVNAMNTRFCDGFGQRHLFVDGSKAPKFVEDCETTQVVVGGSGDIDKRATPGHTHLTDAASYFVQKEYPVGHGRSRVLVMPNR